VLLDYLREVVGLTGTKTGCDGGSAVPARCWSMTCQAFLPHARRRGRGPTG